MENSYSKIETLYTFESDAGGFNTKNYFYDTGVEVVVFDAQFTEEIAQKSIEFLRTKTEHPITHLVVTHPNPDKFNGMGAFQRLGAKVIVSNDTKENMRPIHEYKKYYFVSMAKMFTEETYPKLREPDVTFQDTYILHLSNGKKVELRELHMRGISTNQTIASLPSLNTLLVGDLIHHKAHAWLEGPIVNGKTSYSTENWIAALKRLEDLYPRDARVYGGRGESGDLGELVREQIAYLKEAETIARDYVNSLEGEDLAAKKARVNYGELAKKFEEAFGNYSLSYMITYGAYGLVNSLS
ncbi:MAG: MBL fold metallo-hydrolase [Patescibacteria group bacterium]